MRIKRAIKHDTYQYRYIVVIIDLIPFGPVDYFCCGCDNYPSGGVHQHDGNHCDQETVLQGQEGRRVVLRGGNAQ